MTKVRHKVLSSSILLRDDPTDASILHEIVHNDEYGIYPIAKAHQQLAGWIIDCGAHAGVFTTLCNALWPDAKILCAEPHPENWSLLKTNVESKKTIRAYNCAFGNKNGVVHLCDQLSTNTGGSSVSEFRNVTGQTSQANLIEVEAKRLSSMFKKHRIKEVSLLKLDCEGSEFAIVEDLFCNNLLKSVCWIRGEYHIGESLDPLNKMLHQLHFTHEMSVTSPQNGLGFFAGHRKRAI